MSILWNIQLHFADEEAEVQKSSMRAIEEPCYLREEADCKPGCAIPIQGLWFPQLSSECSHSHVAVAQRYPSRGPPSCCLQMPCPHPQSPCPSPSYISAWGLAASGISHVHSSPNWTIASLLSTQIFLIISPPTQSTYFLFMGVNIKPAGLIFHREPFQQHLEPSKFKEQESWFSARFIIKGFTINIRIWIPPK